MPISYAQVSGADIAQIVALIEETVDGLPNLHVSIACYVVAILAQNPNVAANQIQELVKGLSEYTAASLEKPASGAIN